MEYISVDPGLRRGSTVYHINDGYYFNLVGSDSTRAYLKCNRKTCPARASMPFSLEDRTVDSLRVHKTHNHGTDHNRIQVTKLKRDILRKCMEEKVVDRVDFRRIFYEECAKFDIDVSKRIVYRSMYLMTNRARRSLNNETATPKADGRDKPRPAKSRRKPVISRVKARPKRGARFNGRHASDEDAVVSPPPAVEEVMDDDNVVVFYVGKRCPEALKDEPPLVNYDDYKVDLQLLHSLHEADQLPAGSEVALDGVQPATAEVAQAIIAAAAEAAQAATAKIVQAITAASAKAMQAAVDEFLKATTSATAKVTQALTTAATEATKAAAAEIAQIVTAAAAEATKSAAGEVAQAAAAETTQVDAAEFAQTAASEVERAITAAASEATKAAAAKVAQAVTAAAVKAMQGSC